MLTEHYKCNSITAIKVKVMIECWHFKWSESFFLASWTVFWLLWEVLVICCRMLKSTCKIYAKNVTTSIRDMSSSFPFFVPFFYIFRPTATKNAFEDNGGWFLAKAPIPYHSWLVRQLFNFDPSENMRKVWTKLSGFLSTATSRRKLRQGWPGWGEALTPGGR